MVQIVLHVMFAKKQKLFFQTTVHYQRQIMLPDVVSNSPQTRQFLIPNRELTTEWGAFFGSNGLATVDLLLSGKGQPFEGAVCTQNKKVQPPSDVTNLDLN